jgi:cytochrome P450
MNAIEPVYMELVDFVARGVTPEDVANFRPSVEAQMRVADLLEKQRESQLTDEETAELNGFVELENILGLAKAKAQLILATRS